MITSRAFLVCLVLVAVVSNAPADELTDEVGKPRLVGWGPQTPPVDGHDLASLFDASEGAPPPAFPSVRFRWPHVMTDWWSLANYVDLDAGGGILDYECQSVSYNGHFGNDIIIRDFYEQDQGRFILAAADGVVAFSFDGNFDKNTSCVGNPNYVALQHFDGTYSFYLHMKQYSVLVAPGDQVYEGQPIGQVGSSGCSTDSHLHFEVQNAATVYESYAGPCRAGVSLWNNQQGHVSGAAQELFYLGMSTVPPTGNSVKERAPDMTHVLQTGGTVTHFVWYRVINATPGNVSRVIWRRPNGTIYADIPLTHTTFFSYGWWNWAVNLPTAGSTGTWTVEYLLNNVLQESKQFVYDTTPYQNPQAVGRTVNVDRGLAADTLEASDAEGDLTTFIATNPSSGKVELSGPRNRRFLYSAEGGFSGTDTFQVQAQDAQGNLSAPALMTMNVSPVVANALRLENDGDYIRVPAHPALNLLSRFTLEAWIRRDTGSAGWSSIFDRRHQTLGNNFGFHLFLTFDGFIRLGVGTGGSATYALSASKIPLHEWTHVAATWDSASLRIYLDGVQDGATVPFTGPISYSGVGETRIGGSFLAGEGFRGEIEEARIWRITRSAADLLAGATCAFAEAPLPPSVVAAWRLQGNASDDSANAIHGSEVNGAWFRWVPSPFDLSDCTVQDLDSDTLADQLDNCPLIANAPQSDGDSDGFGDACDLCPVLFQRERIDVDHDGAGDPCDNCPFLGNTEQLDGDSDGSGDLCDPQPLSASVGVPLSLTGLLASHNPGTGDTTFMWDAESHSATYLTVRGTRQQVEDRFYGYCQNTRDPNTTDTSFVEDQTPGIGEVFFFNFIGVSSDGTRGLAGTDWDGRQRDFRAKDCL